MPEGETKYMYMCDQCSKEFTSNSSLLTHMLIHSSRKPHLCSRCGRGFRVSQLLARHMRTHHDTQVPQYGCDECHKKFKHVKSLEYHLSVHTGKKPFVCMLCSEAFRLKVLLNRHMNSHKFYYFKRNKEKCTSADSKTRMIHARIGSYRCAECYKRFTTKYSLDCHMTIHTGEKQFICCICEKKFRLKKLLDSHVRTHNGQKYLSCTTCEVRFFTCEDMKAHMKGHADGKKYRCVQCKMEFQFKHFFELHMKRHGGENPYSCIKCDERFSSRNKLRAHRRSHDTREKPFVCSECDRSFRKEHFLQMHYSSHNKPTSFMCDQCSKQFTSINSLKWHMTKHNGEKPFACTMCVRKFIVLTSLRRHMRKKHNADRTHTCSKCEKRFWSVADLHDHVKKNHSKKHADVDEEKSHSCEVCQKRFIRIQSLKAHSLIHTGEKPFVCYMCETGFRLKGILQRHIQSVHDDPKTRPYACLQCDKTFRVKAYVHRHLMYHCLGKPMVRGEPEELMIENEELLNRCKNNEAHKKEPDLMLDMSVENIEQPYGCHHCNKNFRFKQMLELHIMKSHTGEKPYGCDQCGERFSSRLKLNIHAKVHDTREKPFACTECNNTFAHKYHLQRHMKQHGGVMTIVCPQCDEKFTTKANLKLHRTSHHETRSEMPMEIMPIEIMPMEIMPVEIMPMDILTDKGHDVPVTWEILSGSTKRGQDLLFNNYGHSYTFHKTSKDKQSRYWMCTKRSAAKCKARVTQRGDVFTPGVTDHVCKVQADAMLIAKVKAAANEEAINRPNVSAQRIVDEVNETGIVPENFQQIDENSRSSLTEIPMHCRE